MQFKPIATIISPYKQKFAIPRQPNLVKQAVAEIHFLPGFADANSLRGIEQFSHLWLVFAFHETAEEGWSPLIHPPRLGGKDKMGVYATRSTHRPNPIGISVVEYLEWEQRGSELVLKVRGIDLLDGTPLLDIKPYVPYADSIPDASAGYADSAPLAACSVTFTEEAEAQLSNFKNGYPELKGFIVSVLSQDPRPAYRQQAEDSKQYGMSLYDLNIRWKVDNGSFVVTAIYPWKDVQEET